MRASALRWLRGVTLIAAVANVPAFAHGIMLGVGVHFINVPSVQPTLLDLARKIGFDAIRDDAEWKFVETTKGVYRIPPAWDQFVDSARQRGIEPLLILDYGNPLYDRGKMPRSQDAIDGFVRYASFVVKHFAGRVHYYEIWNEWNTGTGGFWPGGSVEDYARLFQATYPAIKKTDPTSVVLASSGYNVWYEQIAKLGIASRADGVAIHPYVPKEADYVASKGSNGPERSAQRVIDVEATMRRLSGDKEIPLYITEIGWSTSTEKRGFPEPDVAVMACRSLLMFSALPYVRGVWWYDLIDDGPDNANAEDRFGLLRQNYAFKPAATAIQSIASLVKSNDLTLNPASNPAAGLVVLNRRSSPQPSIIAWHIRPAGQSNENAGSIYAVSCAPSLKLLHAAHHIFASQLIITATPSVFTYGSGRCTRQPLAALR